MQVIGINIGEEAKQAKGFRDKHGLTYLIVLDKDGSCAEKYGVEGVPTNVIIDRKGTVRYLEVGFDAQGMMKLKELIGQ